MESNLEPALKHWAEQALEGIGVYKDRVSNFEELQRTAIERLRATYSAEVLACYFEPKNMRTLPHPDGFARVTGPCGDTMQFYLKVEGDKIVEASFQTDGCLPSIASGGMTAELARGRSLSEAHKINQKTVLKALGGLPESSTHCALLAANTLKQAVESIPGAGSGRAVQKTRKHRKL